MNNKVGAKAIIPELQAQMQWVAGTPQTSSGADNRILYDFNNSSNFLFVRHGELPNVIEASTCQQESTICDPETGEWVLFFDGNNIFDKFRNKVNPQILDTKDHTYLTAIIAPSLSRGNNSYYIFYLDRTTLHLIYGIVSFPAGFQSKAIWVGSDTLDYSGFPSPFGLACVNEEQYWVLALSNSSTLVAYKFDTSGDNVTSPVHIPLQPFSSFVDVVDCTKSSIVTFGNHIAITVNNKIMVGTMSFKNGFSINSQYMVDQTTCTLMPAFDSSGEQLYYLKALDAQKKNHVWVCDIKTMATYSADSTYTYGNQYITLKLTPAGDIYGINIFTSVDPILHIVEDEVSGTISVSELLSEVKYSSATFGNNQYQLNTLVPIT